MRNNIFFVVICYFVLGVFENKAQNLQINCVTYKVDRYTFSNEEEFKEDDALKAFRSLEYELLYNSDKSIYRPVEKLDDYNDNDEYKFAKFVAGYFFFKDIKSKVKVETSEIQGEKFNIIKDFEEYKWIITDETKTINGYKCYKATCHIEYKDIIRARVNNFYPTVWFAPSIPAPFGPSGLDGLPGLVLEATINGRIYYYATKIDLKCKVNTPLEKPMKGRYVSQSEFNEINDQKFNEMIHDSGR